MFVHLTLVPYIPAAGELKTKPTQHSVKELPGRRHPARPAAVPLATARSRLAAGSKIAQFCNVRRAR